VEEREREREAPTTQHSSWMTAAMAMAECQRAKEALPLNITAYGTSMVTVARDRGTSQSFSTTVIVPAEI
jgi:hypothetical protein